MGKSTMLTKLTGTKSEAAAYEFTTLTCIPGVIHYNDAKIQLLDLPGIIEGAAEGKGDLPCLRITWLSSHCCIFWKSMQPWLPMRHLLSAWLASSSIKTLKPGMPVIEMREHVPFTHTSSGVKVLTPVVQLSLNMFLSFKL